MFKKNKTRLRRQCKKACEFLKYFSGIKNALGDKMFEVTGKVSERVVLSAILTGLELNYYLMWGVLSNEFLLSGRDT